MKLPFPASNLSPQPIPPERRPQPGRLEGPFEPNTALRGAQRLFQSRVIGSGAGGGAGMDGRLCLAAGWLQVCAGQQELSPYSSPAESVAVAPDGTLWMLPCGSYSRELRERLPAVA